MPVFRGTARRRIVSRRIQILMTMHRALRLLFVLVALLCVANVFSGNVMLQSVLLGYEWMYFRHFAVIMPEENSLWDEDKLIPEEDLWEPHSLWNPALVESPATPDLMQAAVRDAVARQDQLDLIQRDALAYTPYPEERAFSLAGEDEEYLNSRGAPSSHFHLPDPSANFTAAETVEGRVDHLSGREAEHVLEKVLGQLHGDRDGYRLVHRLATPQATVWLPKPLLTRHSVPGSLEGSCKALLGLLRESKINFTALSPEHLQQATTLVAEDSHLIAVANAACRGANCSDYQSNWDYKLRCGGVGGGGGRRSASTHGFCQSWSSQHPVDGAADRVDVPWLLPLYGPWSGSFQHFTRDYAPKLALMPSGVLRDPRLHILVEKSSNPIVLGILNAFGVPSSRHIIYSAAKTYVAERLYIPAVPVYDTQHGLYHRFRRLIGVKYKPPPERRSIIYFSRNTATRKVTNEGELLSALRLWAKERGLGEEVTVFARQTTLEDTIRALSDAKLMIGAHGGAMYNSMLVPKHTAIIEFAPLKQTYHTICRSASVLGHWYWMFPWHGVGHSTPRESLNIRLLKTYFAAAMNHMDRMHPTQDVSIARS